MATIKSYSDISQSKTLSKILPLESADMYYFCQIDNDYFPPDVESICPIPLFKDGKEDFNYDIRCWSLAALLSVLPHVQEFYPTVGKLVCRYKGNSIWTNGANPVDACVAMIEKLHELNLL